MKNRNLVFVLAFVVLATVFSGCAKRADGDALPTHTAPLVTDKMETPLTYEKYIECLNALDMDVIISQAMKDGYPEELNWERNPELLSIDELIGPAYELSCDLELIPKSTKLDMDTAESIASGASIEYDQSEFEPWNGLVHMSAPERLEELAARDEHIVVFSRVVDMRLLGNYKPDGGGEARKVYYKVTRFCFINIERKELVAWVEAYDDVPPYSMPSGRLGGSKANILNETYLKVYSAISLTHRLAARPLTTAIFLW